MVDNIFSTHGRIISFVASLTLFFATLSGFSQQPTTQDCLGAIAVCDYIYVEEFTASGYGNYYEIPNGGSGCPSDHCMDGEKNSRWYIFSVVVSGDLKFEITPQTQTDDYDWAVFNLTQHKCQDIADHASWVMRSCNAAGGPGYQGSTGISTLDGGMIGCNDGGATNKWNADLPVYEGETYVLVVSDWTQTPGGYTLDFSESTAVIFDDQKPYIDYIGGEELTDCGATELLFTFNENVKCPSIIADDFTLTGPGGSYTPDSIYGANCELGGANEKEFILYFTPGMVRDGTYTLEILNLTFISDACNNYADPKPYEFEVVLDAPIADAGENIDIAYGETAILAGSGSGGSGTYSYQWEPAEMLVDPNMPNPTTVNLTASTRYTLTLTDESSTCVGEDNVWVNVVGGPLGVTIDADNIEICGGEILNLYAFPDGGSGNYTYSWTSDPAGFQSDKKDPSDFPQVTTTYKLEITDGFVTISDDILITVNDRPTSDAGNTQTINEGTSTTLNGTASGGTGNYTYLWQPASFLESNDIPNPKTLVLDSPVTFTLIVTDENGCVSEPDVVLVNTEGQALSALPFADKNVVCFGEEVKVEANATGGGGEYTYNWTSEPVGFTSNESDFKDEPEQTTTYRLIVTDQFENEFSAHVVITVNALPVINLVPNGMIPVGTDTIGVCVRDSVVLDAGQDDDPAGSLYFWNANYEGRYLIAQTNGNWFDWQTHNVTVQNNETKCVDSAKITILFDFSDCAIEVPENKILLKEAIGIYPNPNNGQFELTIYENLSDINIKIIDVSGRKVYEQYWKGYQKKGNSIGIDAVNLEKGFYIVKLETEGKSTVKRIIIQ